jgi:hypothetical protein
MTHRDCWLTRDTALSPATNCKEIAVTVTDTARI